MKAVANAVEEDLFVPVPHGRGRGSLASQNTSLASDKKKEESATIQVS